MNRPGKAIVLVLMAGLLAACGGGGGGDDDSKPAASGVTITTANAEIVSAEILNSVDLVEGVSSGSALITGVAITATSGGFNYRDFFLQQLDKFSVVSQQQLSSGLVGIVIPATTEACSDGGTVTISGNVADPMLDTLSAGDALQAVFSNCNESGVLISGGLDLTINAISGSIDGATPFDIDVSVIMNDLVVTDAGITFSGDGDMRLVLAEDASGNYEATFSGNSLAVSEGTLTEALSSYRYLLTGNDSTGDYSLDISGTLDSAMLGGAVSFITLQAFIGSISTGTGDPAQGVLLMTSDFDGSRARLTAQPDGINVMIEVDADGDGGFEATVMTTWVALDSL